MWTPCYPLANRLFPEQRIKPEDVYLCIEHLGGEYPERTQWSMTDLLNRIGRSLVAVPTHALFGSETHKPRPFLVKPVYLESRAVIQKYELTPKMLRRERIGIGRETPNPLNPEKPLFEEFFVAAGAGTFYKFPFFTDIRTGVSETDFQAYAQRWEHFHKKECLQLEEHGFILVVTAEAARSQYAVRLKRQGATVYALTTSRADLETMIRDAATEFSKSLRNCEEDANKEFFCIREEVPVKSGTPSSLPVM